MSRIELGFLAHGLETARDGTTRKRIASQADAHYRLVECSLTLLKDLNLLKETHNSPVTFVTTERGLQFLHDYERLAHKLGFDDRPRQ